MSPYIEEKKTKMEKRKIKSAYKKKKKGVRIALMLSAAVVVLTAAGYVGVAIYYRTHFFPGSTVNGMVCGNMTVEELAVLADSQHDDYVLQISGRDYATGEYPTVIGEVRARDISLAYEDARAGVEELLEGQNEWQWILAYIGRGNYKYSLNQGVRFDENMLRETVGGWEACQSENMKEAQNAYISDYDGETGKYQIIPETEGTELDLDKAMDYIVDAVYAEEAYIDLNQLLCYKEAEVKATDQELKDAVDTVNTWLGTEIAYNWNGARVVLDSKTLKDWITIEQNQPVLDEASIAAFVEAQAEKYDTYKKPGKFVTVHGVELTLPRLSYGWATDTEEEAMALKELICQGSVTEREPVYSMKARKEGQDDIGSDYIEADLTHQHLYVHQNGQVVFETDVVSGKMNSVPSHATPAGIFGLTYKTTNAVLRGSDYETPVTYWMPYYGNYGMHDATWRWDFGLTIYQNHGSHGCINLPLEAAAVIYQYVYTGYPIVCYYYEVDPLPPVEGREMPSEEELLRQEEGTLINNETGVNSEG